MNNATEKPMFLSSDKLGATHGFSTRYGGVSPAPFDSLNLGGGEDVQDNINENKKRFLSSLGLNTRRVSWLKQVHGNVVCTAKIGNQEGDALVSGEKGLTLAISTADCYPLLFHDSVHQIIGAAHAGWRGTLSRIAENTVKAMIQLGADPATIHVAIGPGISQPNYEVSQDVIEQFLSSGFPSTIHDNRLLNLSEANRFVLLQVGISLENIDMLNRCSTETDFFSYRRDHGKTGRMWSVIAL
jgi:hypothetical protein